MLLGIAGKTGSGKNHVADLLEQDYDAGRGVVVVGVSPDHADGVHHGSEQFLALVELRLFVVLEVVTQRLEVHVDVLRFRETCNTYIHT